MTPEKWTKSIDESTKAFLDAFSGLTAEQLNWKPDPNTWSIGQNIHHLIVINSTYYPTFEALKSGQHKTPFIGKIGFITNFFGNFILKSVQPEYERKTRTLPIWEPSKSDIDANILEQFKQHQEGLKKWISEIQPMLGKGVVISSPANKNIVYKLETALDIITTHEKRHFEQARRILVLQS